LNALKILLVTVIMLWNFFGSSYAFEGDLKDGTYEGEFSFVKVRLTVAGGKVENIQMVKHGGGGQKYADIVEPLMGEMVAKQTTAVDAITGATVRSKNLIKAVEDALRKAAR
jgi:uncharacterized protein with FMN-binding domain